jgi:hypothetical protein
VDLIGALAVVAACLVAPVVVFQLGLAAGAPWGAMAYGGRVSTPDGTLPGRYRAMSVVGALVLAAATWLILVAGSVVGGGPVPEGVVAVAMWVLAAMFALNTLGNLNGKHPVEKFGASAMTAVLAILCAVIAVGT